MYVSFYLYLFLNCYLISINILIFWYRYNSNIEKKYRYYILSSIDTYFKLSSIDKSHYICLTWASGSASYWYCSTVITSHWQCYNVELQYPIIPIRETVIQLCQKANKWNLFCILYIHAIRTELQITYLHVFIFHLDESVYDSRTWMHYLHTRWPERDGFARQREQGKK